MDSSLGPKCIDNNSNLHHCGLIFIDLMKNTLAFRTMVWAVQCRLSGIFISSWTDMPIKILGGIAMLLEFEQRDRKRISWWVRPMSRRWHRYDPICGLNSHSVHHTFIMRLEESNSKNINGVYMAASIDILRSMVNKKVRVTYTNGVSAVGELHSFHLGNNSLVITVDKKHLFIVFSSIRTIQQIK